MDTLTYLLASPWTRIAALVAGWCAGILCAALIARVSQR